MNMSETKGWWTKNVLECSVPRNDTKPEPVKVVRGVFRESHPIEVGLEHLWYSLKAMVFGRTVTDVKRSHDYIRRDLP
jgi:hypothetical protein